MNARAVAATVVITCLGSASWADSPSEVLASCRAMFGGLAGRTLVTLERRNATWQPVGATLMWKGPASDASRFANCTTLTALDFGRSFPPMAPDELGALQALRGLTRLKPPENLEDAGLRVISSLPQLQELDLSRCNMLTDAGLAHLAALPNLRRLTLVNGWIGDASLRAIKPLVGLEELRALTVRDFSHEGVSQVGNLAKLRTLYLENLGAEDVAVIADLPHLEEFHVRTFKAGRAGDLSVLRSVKILGIEKIAGDAATGVRLPENLERLEANQETAARLDLASARRIQSLDVPEAPPDDGAWLRAFGKLQALSIAGMATDEQAKGIGALGSLRTLALRCSTVGVWPGDGVGDEGIKSLVGLKNLQSIALCPSGITDRGMMLLRAFPDLQGLDIERAPRVTPRGAAVVAELKRLRQLRLHFSPKFPADDFLASVRNLVDLEELSLSGNLTDGGLKNLHGLGKLRALDLTESNRYTDEGLAAMMRAVPSLQVIKCSYGPTVQGRKPSTTQIGGTPK